MNAARHALATLVCRAEGGSTTAEVDQSKSSTNNQPPGQARRPGPEHVVTLPEVLEQQAGVDQVVRAVRQVGGGDVQRFDQERGGPDGVEEAGVEVECEHVTRGPDPGRQQLGDAAGSGADLGTAPPGARPSRSQMPMVVSS